MRHAEKTAGLCELTILFKRAQLIRMAGPDEINPTTKISPDVPRPCNNAEEWTPLIGYSGCVRCMDPSAICRDQPSAAGQPSVARGYPRKQDTLNRCCFDVGPTPAQHQNIIGSTCLRFPASDWSPILTARPAIIPSRSNMAGVY